ncbi:unnamed protein product [Trichobilharzia regenti]|nr:unnamed protein product [Trichobilharzia regenti]
MNEQKTTSTVTSNAETTVASSSASSSSPSINEKYLIHLIESKQIKALRLLIQLLPITNLRILKRLLELLIRVKDLNLKNRMTSLCLGTIFGPVLLPQGILSETVRSLKDIPMLFLSSSSSSASSSASSSVSPSKNCCYMTDDHHDDYDDSPPLRTAIRFATPTPTSVANFRQLTSPTMQSTVNSNNNNNNNNSTDVEYLQRFLSSNQLRLPTTLSRTNAGGNNVVGNTGGGSTGHNSHGHSSSSSSHRRYIFSPCPPIPLLPFRR